MKKVTAIVNTGIKTDWDKLDEWQQKSNQYTVTLKYNGRQFTTEFFTGLGWDREPTWKDVLGSLISDYYAYENNPTFEDFANEFGYDLDSRKAEKIYKACGRVAKNLERLLGDDLEEIGAQLQEQGY